MLYATSLSELSWSLIAKFFPSKRKLKHQPRLVVDACFYVVDNGTKWRNLPNDFPPWKTVYHYFRKWSKNKLWDKINLILVGATRFSEGRDPAPSLASIDSQSQTAEPGIEGRGLDGNKKVNGRKRHIAVDCLGLLLSCVCTSANTADPRAGEFLALRLNNIDEFPRLKKILADNAYQGVGLGLVTPVSIEAKERLPGQKGFVPEAFRWAVERTFAWLNRQRRLVRNYEKKPGHQESMNYIANIRICLKRLTKWFSSNS
jgi:putative transposase